MHEFALPLRMGLVLGVTINHRGLLGASVSLVSAALTSPITIVCDAAAITVQRREHYSALWLEGVSVDVTDAEAAGIEAFLASCMCPAPLSE